LFLICFSPISNKFVFWDINFGESSCFSFLADYTSSFRESNRAKPAPIRWAPNKRYGRVTRVLARAACSQTWKETKNMKARRGTEDYRHEESRGPTAEAEKGMAVEGIEGLDLV
jgi:hypothetical protein